MPSRLQTFEQDSPPKLDVHFTVAPSAITYKLVLACAGFRPQERAFKYGDDASPSKPLELGVIILRRSVARLRDFSIAEQAAIAKQYDPSSLVEVTSISNLPNDLKSHFKGWLGQRRENIASPASGKRIHCYNPSRRTREWLQNRDLGQAILLN